MVTFQSKHDKGMLGIIGGAAIFLALGAVETWHGLPSLVPRSWAPVLFVLGLLFIVWTVLDTRYIVADDVLEIRSGPLRWKLPLGSIESVVPEHGIDVSATSPAWSLDRLRITTKDGDWLISPRDKGAFLDALGARDAGLRRESDRLVRAA